MLPFNLFKKAGLYISRWSTLGEMVMMIKRLYKYIRYKNFLLALVLFLSEYTPDKFEESLISRGVMRIPRYKPHVYKGLKFLHILKHSSVMIRIEIKYTRG